MYPVELEIKHTTESNTSASYLNLLPSIGRDGQLHTSIYDKRDEFNSQIINVPFLSSNIPALPAYGVFISQLIRYTRACSSYGCFILKAIRLSNKLIELGCVKERLKSSLRKFYGLYWDLSNNIKFSSQEWIMTLCSLTIYDDNPLPIWLYTNLWPYYRTRPILWKVSLEYLRLVWHADRGRLLLQTPGPVPYGTCICSNCWDQSFYELVVILPDYALTTWMCSNVETNLSWTCLVSGLLSFKHPSVLLFCFKHSSILSRFCFCNISQICMQYLLIIIP